MSNDKIYVTIGASNHTDKERETYDYYATHPKEVASAVCYAWFVWERGYKGDIVIKHFN